LQCSRVDNRKKYGISPKIPLIYARGLSSPSDSTRSKRTREPEEIAFKCRLAPNTFAAGRQIHIAEILHVYEIR